MGELLTLQAFLFFLPYLLLGGGGGPRERRRRRSNPPATLAGEGELRTDHDGGQGECPGDPSGRGNKGPTRVTGKTAKAAFKGCFRCGGEGHWAAQWHLKSRACFMCGEEGHERRDCPNSEKAVTSKKDNTTGTTSASVSSAAPSMVSLGSTTSKRKRPSGNSGLTPPGKQHQPEKVATPNEEQAPRKKSKWPYAQVAAGGKKVFILAQDNTPMEGSVRGALQLALNNEMLKSLDTPGAFIPMVQEKMIRKVGIFPGVLVWDLPDEATVKWVKGWIPTAVANNPLHVYEETEMTAFILKKLTGHVKSTTTVDMPRDKLQKLTRMGAVMAGVGGWIELIRVTKVPSEGAIVTIGVDEEAHEGIASADSQFVVGAAGTVRWSDPSTRATTRSRDARMNQLLNQKKELESEMKELEEVKHAELHGCIGELAAMETGGVEEEEMSDIEHQQNDIDVRGTDGGSPEEEVVCSGVDAEKGGKSPGEGHLSCGTSRAERVVPGRADAKEGAFQELGALAAGHPGHGNLSGAKEPSLEGTTLAAENK